MASFIERSIPQEQLRKLDFLLGDHTGLETMYPPGEPPVQFEAAVSASREDCERFVKFEFFADIPNYGIETFTALLTWSSKQSCYTMWLFSSSNEDPRIMRGNFDAERLVFISEPWEMKWGLQKLRCTFTPLCNGVIEYKMELWEPDGYAKYCTVIYGKDE